MSTETAAFLLSIAGTLVAAGVLVVLYIWPALRKLPNDEALRILVLPHAFRFVGLAFLIDGVVSPELDSEITIPAAWGDSAPRFLRFCWSQRSRRAGSMLCRSLGSSISGVRSIS
jgi:hypothetical protein